MAEQAPTPAAPAPAANGGTTTSTGQPAPSGPPAGGQFESMLVMLVPMVIIFYLLIIRPENKRRKEKESLLSAIKPKDKVITIGGIQGVVVEVEGDDIVLLVDQKKDVKMRFRRSAIEGIYGTPPEEKK